MISINLVIVFVFFSDMAPNASGNHSMSHEAILVSLMHIIIITGFHAVEPQAKTGDGEFLNEAMSPDLCVARHRHSPLITIV